MAESRSQSDADSFAGASTNRHPTTVGHRPWFAIRRPVGPVTNIGLGLFCLLVCFGLWWVSTRGEVEQRWISPAALPSPVETFSSFPSLWKQRLLLANTFVTLRRVALGFALAAAIGIPLGVLAGCFPAAQSFLQPLILFGRNIPIAALIPLTFFFFGINDFQKVMFIFLACVAFVVADTAASVRDVGQQYIDTAYTLGAKRWPVIAKVLVPLSMPTVFDSMRILFGLAFGYIMLAETIKLGNEQGGLGNLILTSQRIGPRAPHHSHHLDHSGRCIVDRSVSVLVPTPTVSISFWWCGLAPNRSTMGIRHVGRRQRYPAETGGAVRSSADSRRSQTNRLG